MVQQMIKCKNANLLLESIKAHGVSRTPSSSQALGGGAGSALQDIILCDIFLRDHHALLFFPNPSDHDVHNNMKCVSGTTAEVGGGVRDHYGLGSWALPDEQAV